MRDDDTLQAQDDPFDIDIGDEDEEDDGDYDEDEDDDERDEEPGWQVERHPDRLDFVRLKSL